MRYVGQLKLVMMMMLMSCEVPRDDALAAQLACCCLTVLSSFN